MLPASEQQPLRGRTQKRWTPGVCGCRVRCYVPRWCWWRHRTGAWERWWRPTPTAAGWEDLWTTETQRGETSVNWVRGNDTTATVSEWPRSWRLCVCVCVCTVVHMILFQSISTKTMRVSHPLRGRKTDFNLPPSHTEHAWWGRHFTWQVVEKWEVEPEGLPQNGRRTNRTLVNDCNRKWDFM